jgi:hypothetical protein
VKKFNQARVNGGSNYDSLNTIGEDSGGSLTSCLCLLVEASSVCLRDRQPGCYTAKVRGPATPAGSGKALL